jgi:hypothetical protein
MKGMVDGLIIEHLNESSLKNVGERECVKKDVEEKENIIGEIRYIKENYFDKLWFPDKFL